MAKAMIAALLMFFALLANGCTAVTTRPGNIARTTLNLSPEEKDTICPAFEARMDSVSHSKAVPGNRATLLTNGTTAFPAMLNAIAKAKQRVSAETYILRMDKTGTAMVEALTAAAKRGCEVRLIIDSFGSQTIEEKDLGPLIAAGCKVRIFNPFMHWTALRINNRDHRKILVVDGQTCFLGGLNYADDYAGDGINFGWRDTHVMVEGPAAYEAEKVFAKSWTQGGTGYFGKELPVVGINKLKYAADLPFLLLTNNGKFEPTRSETPPYDPGVEVRICASYPDSIKSYILDMYLLAINSAQQRIWITNGYFVPPLSLKRALNSAAQRGVDVRLLLQGVTDEPTLRTVSLGEYGSLLKHGVKIYEWRGSIIHAKTMVADSEWCTIGSANLDGRALFLDYEANATVRDPALAEKMAGQFLLDIQNADEIDYESWSKRSSTQKIKEKVLFPASGQF